MSADRPGQDPKTLWRELDLEADPMTLEQIHDLARRFDQRARVPLLLAPPALIVMAFIGGQQWQMTHNLLVRAMWVADIGGMLLSFYLVARSLFPSRDPAEPAGMYLRRRLQRSLTNLRGGWVIAITRLLPGMILGLFATWGQKMGPGLQVAPIWARLLPLVVLAAAVFLVLIRTRSGARAVIEQLNEVNRLLEG